jgi:hypothetical protein
MELLLYYSYSTNIMETLAFKESVCCYQAAAVNSMLKWKMRHTVLNQEENAS